MKPLLDLPLPDPDRKELERRANSQTIKARDNFRANIILMRGRGLLWSLHCSMSLFISAMIP
ncbi:MAG: hypothetical protein ACOX9C_10260 [Kiritimatiellia bacterium]